MANLRETMYIKKERNEKIDLLLCHGEEQEEVENSDEVTSKNILFYICWKYKIFKNDSKHQKVNVIQG